uniref:Uncharacterized protein n=1 Tax=Micrurus corallinus TaxID=54390 RepID=A0A2D4FAQ2_MICCO
MCWNSRSQLWDFSCCRTLLKRRWILCYYSGWLLCGIHNMHSIGICLVAVSWAQTEKAAGRATGVMEMQKNQLMKMKYHKRLAKIAIALSYNKYTKEQVYTLKMVNLYMPNDFTKAKVKLSTVRINYKVCPSYP